MTLTGKSVRHCDGMARRAAVVAGATGLAGLSLVDVLRAESATGSGLSRKSVINIHLDGGPPQLDTIDMKMSAPSEIRGEFFPIQTALPGFQICELMPRVASIADRFAFCPIARWFRWAARRISVPIRLSLQRFGVDGRASCDGLSGFKTSGTGG